MTHADSSRGEVTQSVRPRLAPVLYVMLLMLTLATGTAKAQSFSLPISRDVGPNPNSAASGDFNGDGKPDLAVGLTQAASVNIMLGNGNGSFISSITYNTDLNPEGTAVGDFNKDGKLDVAVGNFFGGATSTGNISILLGNGDGQFQPAVNYVAGSPYGLTAIDLNSDGNLDLVTASWTTNKVTVLLGKGDGTFHPATAYPVGTEPQGSTVADFNKDGKLDLAVSNFSSSDVSILKGNGDGTFQAAVSHNIPAGGVTGIAAGDLNIDGNQDLVGVSPNVGVVCVLLGMGDGTFKAPVNYSVGFNAGSPKIADFNGDAKLDIVVAVYYDGTVVVRRGNGDGTFQAANSYPAQNNATALVVSDFNVDGKSDLAVTNNGIGRINILLNSPSPRGTTINATATVPMTGVLVASFTDFDTSKTANSFTAIINWGDGTTTSGTVTANGSGGFNVTASHTYANAGTFTVSVQIADNSGNFANATSTATVAKANQTITFNPLPDKTFGDAAFTIIATGGASGNPVVFSSQTAAVCSVSGSTVTILAAGTCTISASQAGNSNYNAATPVGQSFTVNKALATITLSTLTHTYDGSAKAATAVTDPAGKTVEISYSQNGTPVTSPTNAGNYNVTATINDPNYQGSTTGILVINKATPVITWNNPANIVHGTTLGSTQLNATANVPGTFQYNPPAGTVLNVGTHQLSVTFTPTDTANYTTAQAGVSLTVIAAPALNFDNATYNLNEADGHATIIVNRTGDTSGAATVNYMTVDSAGLNPCNLFNGIASQRCDYALSVGTLRFAAGETAKTIFIPIVDDSYAEGAETFSLTLSNPSGVTLGSTNTATIIVTDNESVTGTNPLDTNSFFVRQHYIDFLGREPEPAGLQGWLNVLNNCGVTIAQPCDRVEVSSGFFRSEEFQTRGYFVYRLYSAVGRIPLYEGFMPDFAKVSGFLSPEELEANKVSFVQEFMTRADYQNLYGSISGNDAYVTALLNTLGLPNHSRKAEWVNALNGGTTRAVVLRQVTEDGQVYSKYYNEAFVIMQYFGYLRRSADISYVRWIETMNSTGGDYRTMINGFLNSAEYRNRFGQ